jgi:hypothetical protein
VMPPFITRSQKRSTGGSGAVVIVMSFQTLGPMP